MSFLRFLLGFPAMVWGVWREIRSRPMSEDDPRWQRYLRGVRR